MFAKLKNKLSLIFSKTWNFLRPQQKLGLVSFVLLSSLIISVWFIFTPVVHAGVGDWLLTTFADIFFALAGFFIKLTFFVLKFIIEVAGYNGFIDSSAVIVGWVMVRDVTNMFFVVVLLIISFGTILGLERYEYKKLLVKLIMAAVIVNFSRIICGLIIDIAQVIMITFVNGIAATASGNLVNMFQVDQIFKLAEGSEAKLGSPGQIFLMGVAAITFAVIMLVTMLTFLFLLMARMAMLWVLIVLSPFAFVLNVLPQTEKYASQWWGEFGGHVVAGPIIAFFLWLSFVTVGSGSAHDEIVKNNDLSQENKLLSGGSPEEETTGLSEIMSWEKMANFAIAIAMLLAGAKMAQQLGVVGGSMMGKAGDLGKKVAMYASGVQAARWGAKKGLEGAKWAGKKAGKFALMKAPIIGGEAWQRRGRSIKARAGFAWGKLSERRDMIAKEMGTLGKGQKGFVGWAKRKAGGLAASAVETTGRKNKRVEDWQKAAENQKKIVEENYSVSSDSGGVAKLESDIRLKRMMAMAEGKKAEKYAKEEERMRSREKIFKLEEELGDTTIRPLKKEDAEKEEKLLKLKEAYKREFKTEVGKKSGDDYIYATRGKVATQSKASSEERELQIAREKELSVAAERDRLGGVGGGGFTDLVRARHAKEDQERASVGSYDKSMNKLKLIEEELAKPGLDQTRRETLLKQKNNLQIANIKRGSTFGVSGEGKIAAVLADPAVMKGGVIEPHSVKQDLTSDNLMAAQANFLSTKLSRQVEKSEQAISEALHDLEKIMGPGHMEQMVDALAAMSEDGAAGYAGMFKVEIDPATNRGKVRATKINDSDPDKEDYKYIKGKRDWALSRANFGKQGFDGSVDSVAGKTVIESARALENIASMFAGLTRQNAQRVDANAVATLAEAIKNSKDKGKSIVDALGKQAQWDGVVALLKRINETLKDKGATFTVPEPPEPPRAKKGKKDDEEDDSVVT